MRIQSFFENEKGELKVIQPPNALLSLWLVLQLVNAVLFQFAQPVIHSFSSLLLFTWSYNELRQGESPFRKALGGVVLLAVIFNALSRWQ
jgi:hypothetical protein